MPHVRICAGGGEQSPSLPRPVYDVLTGLQALAPIPCLGRATGDPPTTQVNGSTPTGDYEVTGRRPPGTTSGELATYGIHAGLTLRGMQGDARLREQVSPNQLRIHGGQMRDGALMATRGCLRVADVDMQSLLQFLDARQVAYPFPLRVSLSDTAPAIVSGDDPSLVGGPT